MIRAFSLFQPVYLAVGVAFVRASGRVPVGRRLRGVFLVAVGSVLAASGVGLLPHLVEGGIGLVSVVAVVMSSAGLVSIAVGAVSALRGVGVAASIAGGVVVLAVLAVSVWIIAPAVAATHVPATGITSTPAQLGLDHTSIELTTSDGVELAAWFLPGTNGAGLVVRHGAGSTRSAVLVPAAALARRGYSVLLMDARCHGDSGGTAMDFGWFGDRDIAAGTAFLASRHEVDPDRIGVVGFSMGGEEAIGAAPDDPRIRAVVAEGATARRASDKAWLSGRYGWRGCLQERVEQLQFGIVDFLTEASPPTTLRTAVGNAAGTRFLLITAGNVADEGHAAAHVQRGAMDRVDVWTIDGAGHTDGYDVDPGAWTRRVVALLDEHLN